MRALVETNDPVLLSFIEALLRDAEIEAVVLDTNMSAVEGSIGIFPRRLLVADRDLAEARRVLIESDLGQWLKDG